MLLTSCELRTSDNGKMEGFWILDKVDTLSTGGSCNVLEQINTWSFQFDLLELRNIRNEKDYVCRFSYTADSLIVSEIYGTASDLKVTDAKELSCFGIDSIPAHYHIDYLTDEHMCLSGDNMKLYLKKY